MTQQEIGHSGSTVVWTNTYQYDSNGNLTYRTCQSSGSVAAETEYVYDQFNRRKAEIQHNTPENTYIGREFWTNPTNQCTSADVKREYTGTAEGTGLKRDVRYQIDNLGRAWQTRQLATPGTLDGSKDRITTLTYDHVGNVLTEAVTDTVNGNAVTEHTYDWRGFRLSTLNPDATQAITYEYDQRGNVTTETTPIRDGVSNVTTHTYDGAGRRTQTIYKENSTSKLQVDVAYDSRGHKTRETSRDPATQAILAQERWEYDAQGNQTQHARMADPGRTTPAEYEDQITRRTYDLMGRLLTETTYGEADGSNVSRTTSYTRDAVGRLTLTTDPLDDTDAPTAFGRGSLVIGRTLTDSIGTRTFTYQHDDLGRLLSETETAGTATATTSYAYDVLGRQIETTDALGSKTSTAYDGLDQEITVVRDAGGINQTVTRVYTQLGHLLTETANDGNADQVTTYAHDKQGRRTDVQLPDNGHWVYTLDGAGRTTTRTDPNGTVIEYARNWRGQELAKKLGVGGPTLESFDYDALGRMTLAAISEDMRVILEYDAFGNVTQETQMYLGELMSKTFNYTWHPCGTLQTAAWADGIGPFQYQHDALDNVTKIKRNGQDLVTYQYAGRRWTDRRVCLDPNLAFTLETGADRNGLGRRISKLTHQGQGSAFKETLAYTRDALGDPNRVERSGLASTNRTIEYLYDTLHRATAADYDDGTNEGFVLDKLGNRTNYVGRDANAVTYAHNVVNEYTSITPGSAPQYSANGNLTQDERGFKYAYDYENRLTQVRGPDNSLLAQLIYDALGRTVSEIVFTYDPSFPVPVSDIRLHFYAIGPTGRGPGQCLAIKRGFGGGRQYTVHGATYVDEVAVLHDFAKNKEYAFELNDTYSVVGVVGDDGRLLRAYEYDVYGRRREINTHWDFLIGIRNHLGESATGELAKYDVNGDGNIDLRDLTKARIPPELPSYQPWGFQGRIRCNYKTSGASPQSVTVYDFRARFYDPTHGRFMQRDPAEYADSYNLYLAFLGNPLVGTDPTGAWTYMELLTSGATMAWQAYTAYSTAKTAWSLVKDVANAWEMRNLTLEGVVQISVKSGELALDVLTGPGHKLLAKFSGASMKIIRAYGEHRAAMKKLQKATQAAKEVGKAVVEVGHHWIPSEALKILERDAPDVYKAVVGKKGEPNIWAIGEELHNFLHSPAGRGGWWNAAWVNTVRQMIKQKMNPQRMIEELKALRNMELVDLGLVR